MLEGFGFAVFFTQYLKLYVGKYRPNWLATQSADGRQAFPYVKRLVVGIANSLQLRSLGCSYAKRHLPVAMAGG